MLRILNSRKRVIIFCLSALMLAIGSMIVLSLLGRRTPISSFITKVQSSECRALAEKVLKDKNAQYSFHRCEKKTYKTSDNNRSISRIYVVAGEVERQWEFECGYFEACASYTGWFDDNNQLFNFADPPGVANHDPAVYTLGCGDPNSSSIYDIEVRPKLVFQQNKYWWQIDYNNTSTASQGSLCKVSGLSLNGYKSVLSNVKAEYLFDTQTCDKNKTSPCQTAKALKNKSIDPCLYDNPTYNLPYSDFHPGYDHTCLSNYIVQTGDLSVCNIKTVYGPKVPCDEIIFVKKL